MAAWGRWWTAAQAGALVAAFGMMAVFTLVGGGDAASAVEHDDVASSTPGPPLDDAPVGGATEDDRAVDEPEADTGVGVTGLVQGELEGRRGRLVTPNSEPAGPSAGQAATLSWRWVATRSETVRFETHGSEIDTVLTVTEVGAGTPVAVGDDDGDVDTSSVTLEVEVGTAYDVEVAAKDAQPGLVTLGWYPVGSSGAPAVSSLAESATVASFAEIPISANTGEKPQSKVWERNGTWYAVAATQEVSPAGAWVWQLGTDQDWRPVVRLSGSTDVRGDVKQDGDVVHVLLHGPSSELVSIEYDTQAGGYVPWSGRPMATPVSLPGSETATLDIDSTGRMWIAVDDDEDVAVYHAVAPYTSFSSRVVIASGIDSDDITAVTALPSGRIGVLWSNQETERFGFKTHVDGAAPDVWSADEVPASQSASSTGGGMADDHLNIAVASDGTLYAAVKTSWDTSGRPTIALLVRRPSGNWDPLHPVDEDGTRGIVVLNETAGTVSVLYADSVSGGDILARTSATSTISFGNATEVISGGLNNPTSTKATTNGQTLILASDSGDAVHGFLGDTPLPTGPVAADQSITAQAGRSRNGQLRAASSSGGPLTFAIVDDPTTGTVEVTDAATGAFTYTPEPDAIGTDTFTFRVAEAGTWSDPATVSITITDAPVASGERGWWALDEGSGSVAVDWSGFDNDGQLVGTPGWTTRGGSPALLLDGDNDYVRVPDDDTLDVTDAITIAAWIRPARTATQYVVKKALGSTTGYELSLSSTGSMFVRFNRASSNNTYRVDSTSDYPTNGDWVHLAATFDGTTTRLYVNGVQEATGAGPPTGIGTNTHDLVLGAESDGDQPFQGGLDDVHLDDRALTAQQIADLASRPASAPVEVVRHGGATRYHTAAVVAERFPPGVAQVFLATGQDFPDAVAAVPVAAMLEAPLLLVRSNAMPAATADALERLAPGAITILGGEAAVSSAVRTAARSLTGGSVDRVAGANRYETAAELALRHAGPSVPVVYIASGTAWPDAIAGGPAAAVEDGVLLLVSRDGVPDATRDALSRLSPGRIVVLGGEAVVGPRVVSDLARFTDGPVVRRAGPDRYATAAAVVRASFPGARPTSWLATGTSFADGLTGGVVAGIAGEPLVLVARNCMPDDVLAELDRMAPGRLDVLGGPGAVGPRAVAREPCPT